MPPSGTAAGRRGLADSDWPIVNNIDTTPLGSPVAFRQLVELLRAVVEFFHDRVVLLRQFVETAHGLVPVRPQLPQLAAGRLELLVPRGDRGGPVRDARPELVAFLAEVFQIPACRGQAGLGFLERVRRTWVN